MMEDTSKKEFVKDCLREFLYKHSVKSPFLFNVPGDCSFIVNKNNIEALTDFLFSEMENQKSFFEYINITLLYYKGFDDVYTY